MYFLLDKYSIIINKSMLDSNLCFKYCYKAIKWPIKADNEVCYEMVS